MSDTLIQADSKPVKRYKDIDFRWTEISDKHKGIAVTLVENAMRLKELIKMPEFNELHDDEDFRQVVQGGNILVGTLANTLGMIQKQHAGKKGRLSDADDYNLALKLSSDYDVFENDMLLSLATTMRAVVTLGTKAGVVKGVDESKLTALQAELEK